jgi:hypothetical protein
MLSIIWEKRSIPLYWRLLDKKGSSNIHEQQALIAPVLELLSDYEIIILGDREYGARQAGILALSEGSEVYS